MVLQHVPESKQLAVAVTPMEDANHQAACPIFRHTEGQLQQGQSREASDKTQKSTTQIQETTAVDDSHGSVGQCDGCWDGYFTQGRSFS